MEINYDYETTMKKGFPQIRKLGAVSPNGEASPFVWKGKLMRLELEDVSRGTDSKIVTHALIRDRESGEILSCFGEGCYYYSFYMEKDTAYVLGTESQAPRLCGDTIRIFESRDLLHWESRVLLENPGWSYYNT